jgi:hypothetical protein
MREVSLLIKELYEYLTRMRNNLYCVNNIHECTYVGTWHWECVWMCYLSACEFLHTYMSDTCFHMLQKGPLGRGIPPKSRVVYMCIYECMCICMYVCVYVCIYICMYIYIYTHTQTRTYSTHALIHMWFTLCIHSCTCCAHTNTCHVCLLRPRRSRQPGQVLESLLLCVAVCSCREYWGLPMSCSNTGMH